MAKANLALVDGTAVAIEGTAEEVALLLQAFSASPAPAGASSRQVRGKARKASPNKSAGKSKRKG